MIPKVSIIQLGHWEKQGYPPLHADTVSPKQVTVGVVRHTARAGVRHTVYRGLPQARASPQQAPDAPHLPHGKSRMARPTQVERQTHAVRDEGRCRQDPPKGPPARTPGPRCVRVISQLSCPRPRARSLPDPGYKYLPLHPGGICLTQATMATAFLPPLGGHAQPCWGEARLPHGSTLLLWERPPLLIFWK